jgi:hypothetical protein
MVEWRFSSHRWVTNHYSWGMCTTFVECKIIMAAVLMIMSGMNPHMINWNLGWVWFGWEFGHSCCLGRSIAVNFVVC